MPTLVSTKDEQAILAACQEVLNYTFQKPELLRAALTHTSGANTRLASNERMEFLGDAVLGVIVCEQLYARFPKYQEGDLTKVKSTVVSRTVCARLGHKLGLGEFVFLGRGMQVHARTPSNLLADVFESILGAIFLDGGLEVVKQFLLPLLKSEIDQAAANVASSNAKSLLQQIGQRKFGGLPRYLILDEQGPDHCKSFKVAAEINRHFFPAAWGKNKKEAELRAAMNALADIQGLPLPHPV